MDCIFCKIIDESLPSYKIYEDKKVVAFLDILPISLGHTIIVSKCHVSDLENLSEEDFAAMSVVAKKVGKAIMDGLGVEGYSIFLDNKSAANQHVPHVHFHIVPRTEGDGLVRWSQSGYEDGIAENCLKQIKAKL